MQTYCVQTKYAFESTRLYEWLDHTFNTLLLTLYQHQLHVRFDVRVGTVPHLECVIHGAVPAMVIIINWKDWVLSFLIIFRKVKTSGSQKETKNKKQRKVLLKTKGFWHRCFLFVVRSRLRIAVKCLQKMFAAEIATGIRTLEGATDSQLSSQCGFVYFSCNSIRVAFLMYRHKAAPRSLDKAYFTRKVRVLVF